MNHSFDKRKDKQDKLDKYNIKKFDDNYDLHQRSNYKKTKRYKNNDDKSISKTSNEYLQINSEAKNNNNEPFLFTKFQYELNKTFTTNPYLIQDLDDFWIFVKKYETLETKFGKSVDNIKNTSELNTFGIPNDYNKSYCINIKINVKFDELFSRILQIKELNEIRLLKFKEIILLYLDFKQKEKFLKLKKLRENQENLPVAKYREEIIETVKSEKVIIIAGDTGCGKSTQIPQYLYSGGFKKIVCTQPRRIACISLAKRVAFETLTENLNQVGYQIRFEKQKNQQTRILFITEGLLLRQVSDETGLSQYDVIVLDEIHERHLYGDFLLGVMKCLIHQRSNLKLVLMSATINIQLFSNYFAKEDVKIIQVPGRLYPIQLMYRPTGIEDTRYKNDRFNPSPYIQIMQIIDNKYPSTEKGDLLIFLSGMSEITAVVDAAKEYAKKKNNWIILPLHSTLSIAEQDKVFDYPPDYVRKCIVSTNIAETSITIDGIRFVTDSGKVKEMSYDSFCKMQKLKEFWISKASAEQRKGRAGRTGPGVCYRIYSEEEYTALDKYSTPEIQRVPLDSLLLQMMAMGLPDARKFPFIEPPPSESVENAILSLKEHGALTNNEKLTCIGKALSKIPVDITIGKMLIMGSIFHQVEPVLSLAASLSIQNPFTNRAYKDSECETSRKNLESDHGDPITLLNAYREWLLVKQESSQNFKSSSSNSRKWCKRRGLEEQRFYEMTKLRTQFNDLLKDCNLLTNISEFNSSMTNTERIIRHREIKILKSLKRTYKETAPKKRKQLKINEFDLQFDEKNNEEIDIKDVEFRMKNDYSQVQNLLNASTACSYKDLTMLKLILCSGIYPQFAIADELNYCKSINEQLFHTKSKPFVALHPMSYFGNHSQILQLEELDIINIPGFKSKTPLSQKHQLLAYLSLLETTKPYLVNTLRMPAAQTLLLFSQEIDTNSVFSMIVCDSWLLLEFPVIDNGLNLLLKATKIRQKWDFLLAKQLEKTTLIENYNDTEEISLNELENELNCELIEFMHTTVSYTIKRLLAADLKTIYVGAGYNDQIIDSNPFQNDFSCILNLKKGGVKLTNNITYNCLIENDWSDKLIVEMAENFWQCSNCDCQMIMSSIEKLQHQNSCKLLVDKELEKIDEKIIKKPNSKAYECFYCKKILYLTPVEILKHKKKHINSCK